MSETARRPAPKRVFVNRFFFPDQSATSQMLSDLAFGLAARGFDIHVVCSRHLYGDPRAALPRSEKIDGVTIHRVASARFGRSRLGGRALDYATFYLASAIRLARLLRRGDTLVTLTDPPLLSIMGMAVARMRGAGLVNWLHDIYPEVATELGANPLPLPLDAWLRGCRDRSLRAACMNVVLGRRMAERVAAHGIPGERLRVIENWSSMAGEAPRPARTSRLRARLDLGGRFVVCYSGNLGRAHDYRTLLEAAELLRAEHDVVFLMVGAGAAMETLRRLAAERGLQNFRFHPYVPREELADSLAAGDVHLISLLPALEGLIVPSKFYGILAAGRPVVFIGDSDGELARIIADARIGATVAVGDSAGLARILCALKSDPGRLDALGRASHELHRERYGAARGLKAWARVLDPTAAASG